MLNAQIFPQESAVVPYPWIMRLAADGQDIYDTRHSSKWSSRI